MSTPTNITEQLTRDEGFRSSVYKDSEGYWTIGTGVCVDGLKGCGITQAENAMLVSNRISAVQDAISKQWPWTDALDPVRLSVLWNMGYQMGVAGISNFKQMLSALQQGDYLQASVAMLDSVWARQQSPARAQRLSIQMKEGIWQ